MSELYISKNGGIPAAHAPTHTDGTDDIQSATATQKGLMTSAYASKLDGIAAGATVGATWGSNITSQPSIVSQAEAEAGSATTERIWTAQRVKQAIYALAAYDLALAVSDETSNLTTGTNKIIFRVPRAFTLTGVKISVTTAPTGSTLIVDVNKNNVSILSTKLSIDIGSKTSVGAATPVVISDTSMTSDAEIEIDIDQVGSTIAGVGLKITFLGILV